MTRLHRFQRSPAPVACAILSGVVCLTLGACSAPLPTYPQMEPAESLRLIAQRLADVKSIQSGASVNFEDVAGVGVHLDAALVAEPPDRLRMRAWKLDRAVFDATLVDGEFWMLPREKEEGGEARNDSAQAAQGVRRAFSLLAPAFYESARVDERATTARQLVVLGKADGYTIRCEIDRETLTPRRFERPQSGNGDVFSIDLEEYTLIDSIPWSGVWTISHAGGRVVIRMSDVVLNAPVTPEAFVPPRRAVRNP